MAEPKWTDVCHEADACALTGAVAFFAAISDAAVVVNGPLWCASYARRYLERQCPTLISRFFCSQADNEAVVFGTEKCLTETLRTMQKQFRPQIVLIVNNCSIGLIGDDLEGIAREAALPCPVVCLDGGGLSGGFREGYVAAAGACCEKIRLEKQREIQPFTVNLVGCSGGYYNEHNDIAELRRMLAMGGVKVLNAIGLDARTQDLQAMTQAALNVVIHAELGEAQARWLQDHYGMPYVVLLPPYGVEDSLAWVDAVRDHLEGSPPKSMAALRREADGWRREIAFATADLERVWNHLWFLRAAVAAPPSVALGLARALRYEWADIGHLTVIAHGSSFADPNSSVADLCLEGHGRDQETKAALLSLQGGLLLGSNSERSILLQQGIEVACCQNIALPVYDELVFSGRPFAGLKGAPHLLSRLWNGRLWNLTMDYRR